MKERKRMGEKYVPTHGWDDNLEPFAIHPDVTFATMNYDGTPRTFNDMLELRGEAIARGDDYWRAEHDVELKQTAEENTKIAAAKGWKFPQVGERIKR